jgi:hypothetical protein
MLEGLSFSRKDAEAILSGTQCETKCRTRVSQNICMKLDGVPVQAERLDY